MFSVNSFNLNYQFSNHFWWRYDYYPFNASSLLTMLSLFKRSIETFKLDKENEILFKEYSVYYKRKYLKDILIGENNLSITEISDYQLQSNEVSTKTNTKIMNLETAIEDLFPDIFFPNLDPNEFNENLAIKMHKMIGKDLFDYAGRYRISDAAASKENFRYLEHGRIQEEMKKLFDFTREKLISFKREQNDESLFKLGLFIFNFIILNELN